MRAAARCTWRVRCSRPRWATSRSTRCSPRPAADQSRATATGIPARPRTSASPARARTSGSRSRSPTTRPGRRCCASPGLARRSIATSGRRPPGASPMWTHWRPLWASGPSSGTRRRCRRGYSAAGVAAGVVHSTLSHLTDPQLEARGWWRFLEHPDTGVRRYGGFPWRFSRTPGLCHATGAPARRAHRRDSWRVAGSQRGRDWRVA